jgi:hypothetical protein
LVGCPAIDDRVPVDPLADGAQRIIQALWVLVNGPSSRAFVVAAAHKCLGGLRVTKYGLVWAGVSLAGEIVYLLGPVYKRLVGFLSSYGQSVLEGFFGFRLAIPGPEFGLQFLEVSPDLYWQICIELCCLTAEALAQEVSGPSVVNVVL